MILPYIVYYIPKKIKSPQIGWIWYQTKRILTGFNAISSKNWEDSIWDSYLRSKLTPKFPKTLTIELAKKFFYFFKKNKSDQNSPTAMSIWMAYLILELYVCDLDRGQSPTSRHKSKTITTSVFGVSSVAAQTFTVSLTKSLLWFSIKCSNLSLVFFAVNKLAIIGLNS